MSIKIPKKAKIYPYLNGDNANNFSSKWELLDAIYIKAEQTREDIDTAIFDAFMGTFGSLYPDKVGKLKKLRALILWHILWGEDLDESYYDKLKEL